MYIINGVNANLWDRLCRLYNSTIKEITVTYTIDDLLEGIEIMRGAQPLDFTDKSVGAGNYTRQMFDYVNDIVRAFEQDTNIPHFGFYMTGELAYVANANKVKELLTELSARENRLVGGYRKAGTLTTGYPMNNQVILHKLYPIRSMADWERVLTALYGIGRLLGLNDTAVA